MAPLDPLSRKLRALRDEEQRTQAELAKLESQLHTMQDPDAAQTLLDNEQRAKRRPLGIEMRRARRVFLVWIVVAALLGGALYWTLSQR